MALRLQVRLLSKPCEGSFVDAPLPPVKGYPDERSVETDECNTPGGLALRFYAYSRGDWGDIVLESAGAVLLKVSIHVNSHVELRLPTEEMIEVAVTNY